MTNGSWCRQEHFRNLGHINKASIMKRIQCSSKGCVLFVCFCIFAQTGDQTSDQISYYTFKHIMAVFYATMWPCDFLLLPGTGSAERRKHRSHKFLCLRVGKPMKKTFVSNASASMQQYAQQGKKHEYWFAVPQERSVPVLHLFTKQDAQGILI